MALYWYPVGQSKKYICICWDYEPVFFLIFSGLAVSIELVNRSAKDHIIEKDVNISNHLAT
jgi:hypothetical protein